MIVGYSFGGQAWNIPIADVKFTNVYSDGLY